MALLFSKLFLSEMVANDAPQEHLLHMLHVFLQFLEAPMPHSYNKSAWDLENLSAQVFYAITMNHKKFYVLFKLYNLHAWN